MEPERIFCRERPLLFFYKCGIPFFIDGHFKRLTASTSADPGQKEVFLIDGELHTASAGLLMDGGLGGSIFLPFEMIVPTRFFVLEKYQFVGIGKCPAKE